MMCWIRYHCESTSWLAWSRSLVEPRCVISLVRQKPCLADHASRIRSPTTRWSTFPPCASISYSPTSRRLSWSASSGFIRYGGARSTGGSTARRSGNAGSRCWEPRIARHTPARKRPRWLFGESVGFFDICTCLTPQGLS